MATILPFKAIRPNPLYADQLVFTKPQAESVSGDYTKEGGLKPLKTLLETGARLRPETAEGQEQAYRDIKETLRNLLRNEHLLEENEEALYVYEVIHPDYRQTAIWCLTDLTDYTEGKIRIHELTLADSVRRMWNYRANTGLEGSPVLLTYPSDGTINAVIEMVKVQRPDNTLGNAHGIHRLWKISDQALQQKLMDAFSKIPHTYLADGHHRFESAVRLAPSFRALSSLYLSFDELRIEAYDRVVIPETPYEKQLLFRELSKSFYIRESTANRPVQPDEPQRMGMYLDGQWHHLLAKDMNTPFGAEFLQQNILSGIFYITDPKTDSRLKCAGGEKALEEISGICQAYPCAIAFTLSPMTVAELVAAADAGRILPPKSTWIIPKVPYGLLIHQHPLHDERT